MIKTVLKAAAVAVVLSFALLTPSQDAEACGGYYCYPNYYHTYYYPVAPYYTEYVYVIPAPVVVYHARPAPWTHEWYAYCGAKYRSFEPRSGTFKPYRGKRKLCR